MAANNKLVDIKAKQVKRLRFIGLLIVRIHKDTISTVLSKRCRVNQSPKHTVILNANEAALSVLPRHGAENGTRTRDPQLGKLMLYQLSYFRVLLAGQR